MASPAWFEDEVPDLVFAPGILASIITTPAKAGGSNPSSPFSSNDLCRTGERCVIRHRLCGLLVQDFLAALLWYVQETKEAECALPFRPKRSARYGRESIDLCFMG